MHSKRLLKKLIIAASVITAMISALPRPASADFLNKRDKIKIGEMRKDNPGKYDSFKAKTDSLFATLKKLNDQLNGLKRTNTKNADSLCTSIDTLYNGLDTLHIKTWTEFSLLAEGNKLELIEVFKTMKKLHGEYIKLILSYSNDAIKIWEKKSGLDEGDIQKIKVLIDVLGRLNRAYAVSDVPLLNRLKVLLAREIDKKFP